MASKTGHCIISDAIKHISPIKMKTIILGEVISKNTHIGEIMNNEFDYFRYLSEERNFGYLRISLTIITKDFTLRL